MAVRPESEDVVIFVVEAISWDVVVEQVVDEIIVVFVIELVCEAG